MSTPSYNIRVLKRSCLFKYTRSFIFFILSLGILFLISGNLIYANTPEISIFPGYELKTYKPDTSTTLTQSIQNETSQELTYNIERGQIDREKYVSGELSIRKQEINNLINIEKTKVVIAPESTKTFDVSVTVPNDIDLGSHDFVLHYTLADQSLGQIGVNSEFYVPILINVIPEEGNPNYNLSIKNLATNKKYLFNWSNFNKLFKNLPKELETEFTVKYSNSGDYIVKPRGILTVSNSKGLNLYPNRSLNDEYTIMFPQQQIEETKVWNYEFNYLKKDNLFKIETLLRPPVEKYSITVDLYPTIQQQFKTTETTHFYVVNTFQILLLTIILISITFILVVNGPEIVSFFKKVFYSTNS